MDRYLIRTGSCNQCGECCGYPKPDGTQNNPFPNDWPESLATWQSTDNIPIFKVLGKEPHGFLQGIEWAWVKDHGLCHVDETGFDIRCPFLSEKIDGKVPCLLYGKEHHFVWKDHCNLVPPEFFTEEEYEAWKKNCPSCSFEYK